MSAVKTEIGAIDPAHKVPHAPQADIPASNVWDAIRYLRGLIASLVPIVGAAPKDAQYLVAVADPVLTAERATTNTPNIVWDYGTAGQAKADLTDTGVDDGAYGSASAVATFTVDAKGRLTVAGSAAIQIAVSAVTGLQDALDAKQPLDVDLTDIAAQGTTAFGRGLLLLADATALETAAGGPFLNAVQDDPAPTLGGDLTVPAGVGVSAASQDDGTISTGTYQPQFADGNVRRYVNNGVHTLSAPNTGEGTMAIQVTNGASAAVITLSGFSPNTLKGDAINTTNTNKFLLYITRINGAATIACQAQQ